MFIDGGIIFLIVIVILITSGYTIYAYYYDRNINDE